MQGAPHSGGLAGWWIGFGGPGLLLYSVADGSLVTLLPGGADMLTLLLAAAHPRGWGYYALMATVGSLLGGLLSYQIAATASARWLAAKVGEQRIAAVRHRGWPAVLAGALLPAPFPYKVVPLAAGAARLPRMQFLAALAVGRGLRFSLAAYIGARYGSQALATLRRARPSPAVIGIAAAAAVALAAAAWLWKRKRRGSERQS